MNFIRFWSQAHYEIVWLDVIMDESKLMEIFDCMEHL